MCCAMVVLFFLFKIFLCFSAFMVLVSKNPVHSVLFLILVFCNGAGLLLLLGLEFLAMIFLVVYVGAIAVLFLFIVMMLNLKISGFRQSLLNHYPISLLIILLLGLTFFTFFLDYGVGDFFEVSSFHDYFNWGVAYFEQSNIHVVGSLLYTYFYLPFVLSGIILLISMIGSIVLALYPKVGGKKQSIYNQVIRSSVIRLC